MWVRVDVDVHEYGPERFMAIIIYVYMHTHLKDRKETLNCTDLPERKLKS